MVDLAEQCGREETSSFDSMLTPQARRRVERTPCKLHGVGHGGTVGKPEEVGLSKGGTTKYWRQSLVAAALMTIIVLCLH